MGEQVFSIVRTRIQAVIRQNKRDEVRTKIGQYLLLILLTLFVVEEVKEILKPRTIFIENAQAQVETIEVKVEEKELSIEDKIRKEFGEEGNIAVAIAKAESSLDPSRIGDKHMAKYSYGLFQINQTWHNYPQEKLLDPDFNIKKAKEIKDKYGWSQWTTYKAGQYLSNL